MARPGSVAHAARESWQTAVVPIHTAVPGRARLRIEGLRGNDALRCAMEQRLPDAQIRAARASSLTGSLLVEFDRQLPLAEIRARIERVLAGAAEGAAPSRPVAEPQRHAWHAIPPGAVLGALRTTAAGLGSEAARERLARHGANTLPPAAMRSPLAILLEQFQSLPVVLLGGAAALSALTGGLGDAVVIIAVIGLNAAIGFATESRTSRIIGTLSLPLQKTVLVRREGKDLSVPTDGVVPGDVLVLHPGTIIAADARVIAADGLSVDESMLTGESLPSSKAPQPVVTAAPLAERHSMVFRSTGVVGGSGLAVAVATGGETEAGHIQSLVGAAETPQTPLQRQLATLGRQLVLISGGVCFLVLLFGLLRGQNFLQMLKSAIALAVAAVPEGLPTVGTTALALGIDKMRRQQVLVRRLRAIETLAAIDVIAFDKTGTLTENRMAAAAIVADGERLTVAGGALWRGAKPLGAITAGSALAGLLEVGVLCNEAKLEPGETGPRIVGSATEVALLRLALDFGIDAAALRGRFPVRSLVYRAEGRQYMESIHERPQGLFVACKGNPDQVLARCRWLLRRGRRAPLTARSRTAILGENRRMAADGLRVLGLAYGDSGEDKLVWLGLVGLADPARSDTKELLSRFDHAGIRVIMMTGDQAATAEAVARRLDLANGAPANMVDASALDAADEHAIEGLARETRVFARATPAQKVRITQALQRAGRIVAVTGDGINDSPALRAANVGIVMGRSGTDAARAVADIVLASDDLAALASALEMGRTTYGNIRKSIHYLLATNFSEILVMLLSTALGRGAVLNPMQLLWINLLSDVLPALALALEPAETGVLERKPHPADAPILGPAEMGGLAREGAIIAAATFGAYGLGLARHGDAARAATIAFSSLVGAQLLHALTARSAHAGLFAGERLAPNPMLAAALLGSGALQVAVLLVPGLRRFMGLAPLDGGDLLTSLAGAGAPYLVNEAIKALLAKRAPA